MVSPLEKCAGERSHCGRDATASTIPLRRWQGHSVSIHGTNQPEGIGLAFSSGCIRLTNEDVIDLYSRAKIGARVVVLGAQQS
jgi:lipoprotein-anchoring transpeptidase ErfK/SrfK